MGRMFCYIWSEKSDSNECKFGEHWVEEGQDPEKGVLARIKQSVGVRKDKFNDGEIELSWFGDVTEYAQKKCPDRLKPRGRVDDEIRSHIGYRKETTGEIHLLSADEMQIRVMRLLTQAGQDFPEAKLSTSQYNAAANALTAIDIGKRLILAELCPRFGKTIWAGVISVELDVPLTIIVSYVLTSFASFEKDLARFKQFQHLIHIDMKDDDAEQRVQSALTNNERVVVYLSMHQSTKLDRRIKFLFNLQTSRLIIVDEADFGMHRPGQARPLITARKKDDVVVLMTGTNGDRAVSEWRADHYMSVTYPELLMEKYAN